MLPKNIRPVLLFIAVVLLFGAIWPLQKKIDPDRQQFEPKNQRNVSNAMGHLPLEFALGAATGFREAIAGLLWVRTDKFFHEGNYDAIVPMVRIITWLDPHNIDVYQTGAWHMDYNFTDQEQRSDRRYIPYSLALLEEGIANNPDVAKLYADLAFTHYFRKLCNYGDAVKWYELAQNGDILHSHPNDAFGQQLPPCAEQIGLIPDSEKCYDPNWDATLYHDPKTGKLVANPAFPGQNVWETNADPTIVGHGLAHAYQAAGMIDKAIAQWQFCEEEHQRFMVLSPSTALQDKQGLSVATKNLKETQARAKWRVTQTQPPANFHFSYLLKRIGPKKLQLQGNFFGIGATSFNLTTGAHTWGPVSGCRVNIRLEDAGYVMPSHVSFDYKTATDLPKTITVMQDSASVRDNNTYTKTINMSEDPGMYSFAAPRYKITLWFDPADPNSAPPNVQDRIGWVGEGLTDKYLDTTGYVPGSAGYVEKGLRQIMVTFYVTKQQLVGDGTEVLAQG